MIPNTQRGSDQVSERSNNTGRMSNATEQHTESSETESNAVEAPFSYDSNPAYRGKANETLHSNELYLSIRQERTEPSGGASAREPIYESPQFMNSEGIGSQTSLEDSTGSYI